MVEAPGTRESCLVMPSLIRFVLVVAVLAGLVYAGMWALATFVDVQPRPMEQAIPPAKFK